MRSLFLSIPWFTPAYKAGGPIQSIANMLSHLEGQYQFYVFTANTDWDGTVLQNVVTDSWVNFNSSTKVFYATNTDRSNEICRQVEALQPSVLYIVGLYNWQFNLVPLFFCNHAHKILSVRGMLHPGALGQKSFKKKIFLALFKILGKHRKITFHATDAAEEKYIKQIFSTAVQVQQAGNFPRLISASAKQKNTKVLKIITVALVSPMKNHWLILQALTKLKTPVQYGIYGPVKDYDYWQQCLAVIKNMPQHINIVIEKELPPESVPQLLKQYDVAVYPSQSENYGHSIIEALSAGLPVICSHHTPWNELEKNQAGLNVELSEEALVQALSFFASMDAGTYASWSTAAADYAIRAVDLELLVRQYAALFAAE